MNGAEVLLQFLVAALLATAVTKIVDTVRNTFDRGNRAPKAVWNLLAFGVGIGLGLSGFNAFAGLHPNETAGEILTGLMLGGGAGGFHELFDLWSRRAKG